MKMRLIVQKLNRKVNVENKDRKLQQMSMERE